MTRTPSIESMNPQVYLLPGMLTDRYYFMEIFTKQYDVATNTGVESNYLMYEKEENSLFEYAVYNSGYSDKRHAGTTGYFGKMVDKDVAICRRLEGDALVEDYEKGNLQGRLKDIAADLDEDSNSVIMLIKYRK